MLFVLRLAAKRTAFSAILPCVFHQNTLHLAAKRTAFSGILHYVLHQIALHLAVNSPNNVANGVFIK